MALPTPHKLESCAGNGVVTSPSNLSLQFLVFLSLNGKSRNVIFFSVGGSQIQKFSMKLYYGNTTETAMVDNFRPVQPLGGRVVYKSESSALLPPEKVLVLVPTVMSLALALTQ